MEKMLLALLVMFTSALPVSAQMMDAPMRDRAGYMHGVQGQMMAGGMEQMDEMMGMCLENADKIGLTDEQLKKLTPLHREMQKKRVRFKADLKIAEMELMEIMEVKDFDFDKATATVKKISELKVAHQGEMLKTMKEIRAILTEEQFVKIKKLKPVKKGMRAKPKKGTAK